MTCHYLMAPGMPFKFGVNWEFAIVGEDTSSQRLHYDADTRQFSVIRLMNPSTYKPRGVATHVDDLVALLPPEELAKAAAASIALRGGQCPPDS